MSYRPYKAGLYFYPRSPCGERRWLRCWKLAARDISIHALLAESDPANWFDLWGWAISIHALLAESDCQWRRSVKLFRQFLSTLSLRRATLDAPESSRHFANFYPRSPCGERPQVFQRIAKPFRISIHALLAESDRNTHSSAETA